MVMEVSVTSTLKFDLFLASISATRRRGSSFRKQRTSFNEEEEDDDDKGH